MFFKNSQNFVCLLRVIRFSSHMRILNLSYMQNYIAIITKITKNCLLILRALNQCRPFYNGNIVSMNLSSKALRFLSKLIVKWLSIWMLKSLSEQIGIHWSDNFVQCLYAWIKLMLIKALVVEFWIWISV